MQGELLVGEVHAIIGLGTVVVGRVASGVLQKGMVLELEGERMKVKSLEAHHRKLKEATEGTTVGVLLSGGDPDFLRSYKGKIVHFTGSGESSSRRPTSVRGKPQKEGVLASLKRLFSS